MSDTTQEITTIGSVAALLAETLMDCDVDPAPLFARAGIELSVTHDPDARIPTRRMLDLWALAIEATGNPCIGLHAARHFQPAMLHGLGFAWLASNTLRDALGRLVRFSRLINAITDIRLEDRADTLDLIMLGPEKWPNFVHAAADLGMAAFLRMCRITACEEISPVCVNLQRPEPECARQFDEFFACPIRYSAVDNRLCFDRDIINRPLATANPHLARVNDQTVMDYLTRFDQASISLQVRSRIIDLLPGGTPNQTEIADSLNISLRSLQRRLKEENTTFKKLLDDTRRDLAIQYILQSRRSLATITYLLGFSEPGNFTRAFRRWTGNTPMEFRNHD
jgi:AraC-like DNA-binding protein